MPDSSPVGPIVPNWTARSRPGRAPLVGRTVRLEPLNPATHESDLWQSALAASAIEGFWNYLGYGPYQDRETFHRDLLANAASLDPIFFAVIGEATGIAAGVLSIMRIDTANGVAEIGHIWFGPSLRRSTAATEAVYLAADHLFTQLGYRRVEWKCNALNAPSRRAADRFGFTYEGTFRQHSVMKERNRDTAWYSIIDTEWPGIRSGFVDWLDPANFDANGHQIRCLQDCLASE